jgi:subtilisin family serine protease
MDHARTACRAGRIIAILRCGQAERIGMIVAVLAVLLAAPGGPIAGAGDGPERRPSSPASASRVEGPVWMQPLLKRLFASKAGGASASRGPAAGPLSGPGSPEAADVVIEFSGDLPDEEVEALEASGIRFFRVGDQISRAGRLYHALAPLEAIPALSERPDVVYIHNALKPWVRPLDVSVPLIRADRVWALKDARGSPLTGEGVLVGVIDTGIDIFHPDFWRPDGVVRDWIDVNASGAFESGIDAVDLDGDGLASAGERLALLDATGRDLYPGWNCEALPDEGTLGLSRKFEAGSDWLYNDANRDGIRNFGVAAGFTEADPGYGERLFIAGDADGDGRLDPGEKLLQLGTCKVKALLDTSQDDVNIEYLRGKNLIHAPRDADGHGTSVIGIVAGGAAGRRFAGVAPGADILIGTTDKLVDAANWAVLRGAGVTLVEIGAYSFSFLDGSDALDLTLDEHARAGVVPVVPAGNLRTGKKHASVDLDGGATVEVPFEVPPAEDAGSPVGAVWISFLWRTPEAPTFRMVDPRGRTKSLDAWPDPTTSTPLWDDHWVWAARSESTRGTSRYDMTLWCHDSSTDSTCSWGMLVGTWTVQALNPGAVPIALHGYVQDDVSSWGGGVIWLAHDSDAVTITGPATADTAIPVRSYSSRGCEEPEGGLSSFSGQGPRIDGTRLLGVAAPGNYDLVSPWSAAAPPITDSSESGIYAIGFGGTSAAGPHVTGACALILQKYPGISPADVRAAIEGAALRDAFTGDAPDPDLWGGGKLDVLAAIEKLWVPTFVRGDADPGEVNLSDAIVALEYLFLGGAAQGCLDAIDVNDDGKIELTDPVHLLGHLFLGGEPPASPYPGCGTDTTPDDLGCATVCA